MRLCHFFVIIQDKFSLSDLPFYGAALMLLIWNILILVEVGKLLSEWEDNLETYLTAGKLSHLFSLFLSFLLPLLFMLPIAQASRATRKNMFICISSILGVILACFCIANLCFLILCPIKQLPHFLQIIVIQVFVSFVMWICLVYLNHKIVFLFPLKLLSSADKKGTQRIMEVQGNIYGAQLVIVGGAAILSAIDGNLELGSRVDKIENYFLHAVIPLKLFYLLSLLIIVQVNHYEQVHSCHYTGIKARSLIQQLRHKHSS